MGTHLHRSIHEPIREGLSRSEMWEGADKGFIWCWELGRQKRLKDPELAARADKGELVVLAWKGGVQKKSKPDKKYGTLSYLATWQGLRGEDLDLAFEDERTVVCTRTGQTVVFSSKLPKEEESETETDLTSSED
jgi:hypothetical protein